MRGAERRVAHEPALAVEHRDLDLDGHAGDDRGSRLPRGASDLKAWCQRQLDRHAAYVVEHLEDMPEVRDWSLGDWAEKG